jgi:hypothetical protein
MLPVAKVVVVSGGIIHTTNNSKSPLPINKILVDRQKRTKVEVDPVQRENISAKLITVINRKPNPEVVIVFFSKIRQHRFG